MIQSYYGNGKGKTSLAVGSAIRFLGCGKKVVYAEFLKNGASSELNILKGLKNTLVLTCDVCYNLFDNLKSENTKALKQAYEKFLFDDIKNKIEEFNMLVLDEVLDAINFGYIDETKFLKFLDEIKDKTEIILTGHVIKDKILDVSDYVSNVDEVKHPYKKGVLPREGIEF